jgi:hypothetical protein
LTQNHENESLRPLHQRAKLTRGWFIALGALLGAAGASFGYAIFLGYLGITLSQLVMTMMLGAFFGVLVTTMTKNQQYYWTALGISAFMGLITPICLMQILFIVAGPGEM